MLFKDFDRAPPIRKSMQSYSIICERNLSTCKRGLEIKTFMFV